MVSIGINDPKNFPQYNEFLNEKSLETFDEENIEEAKKLGLKGPWSEEE